MSRLFVVEVWAISRITADYKCRSKQNLVDCVSITYVIPQNGLSMQLNEGVYLVLEQFQNICLSLLLNFPYFIFDKVFYYCVSCEFH